MTQHWDILSDGSLAVWTHMDDPHSDNPANSTADWDETWPTKAHPQEAERLIEEWIKDQAIPNDIGYQNVTRILVDLRAGEFNRR